MGYLDYQYRQKIDFNTVADLTDTVFYIDLSDMGSDFWSGIEKSDGSDVVITTLADVKINREIQEFDDVAEEGHLWFEGDASASGTSFYVYYGKSDATETNSTDPWANDYASSVHMNDRSGVTCLDSSPLGSGAFAGINSPSYVAGRIGEGVDFVVADDTYIESSDHTVFHCSNGVTDLPRTWLWWVKPDLTASRVMVAKGNSGAEYYLEADGQYMQFFKYAAAGDKGIYIIGPSMVGGSWYHVAFTDDAAAGTDGMKFYINGSLQSVDVQTSGSYTFCEQSNVDFTPGYYPPSPAIYSDGVFDEFRFLTREMSVNEITHIYGNENTSVSSYYTVNSEEKVHLPDLILSLWSAF